MRQKHARLTVKHTANSSNQEAGKVIEKKPHDVISNFISIVLVSFSEKSSARTAKVGMVCIKVVSAQRSVMCKPQIIESYGF